MSTFILVMVIGCSIISNCCVNASVIDGPPCTWLQSFTLQAEQQLFPFECQIEPKFNQLHWDFSFEGWGASAYILTVPQYDAYLANVKKDPKYVPPKYDYFDNFDTNINDIQYCKGVGSLTSTMGNFGKLRMLIKQNPTFRESTSEFSIDLVMTPQYNNAQLVEALIIGSSIVVLSCIGCVGILGIIVFIRKRKTRTDYSEM